MFHNRRHQHRRPNVIYQRYQRYQRPQRYRRHVRLVNQETLRRIEALPEQSSDDPLVEQFFNGSSFY